MAKDDYDVIVYRLLTYLYACMKGKIVYDDGTFAAAVKRNISNDEYFVRALRLMQEEGLVSGLVITKAWGNVYIVASDLRDAEITAAGIRYLKENGTMKKTGEALREAADMIAALAGMIGL